MAAYLVVDIEVTYPKGFEEYRRLVGPQVARYGGKYLVRGGAIETVEGDWAPKRLVILEFDSVARLKRWYESEDYRPLREMRHRTAASNAVIVEGI